MLTVLNRKMFSADDFFEGRGKEVKLNQDGPRRFWEAYEGWTGVGISIREGTRRQAEGMVRHLGAVYLDGGGRRNMLYIVC